MSRPFRFRLIFAAALLLPGCSAQYALGDSTDPPAMATLPDSPGTIASSSRDDLNSADIHSSLPDDAQAAQTATAGGVHAASPYIKLIAPGQVAPPQTSRDKFILGLRESITPFSILSWFTSAGYSHAIDGIPHYGTNSEAFAHQAQHTTCFDNALCVVFVLRTSNFVLSGRSYLSVRGVGTSSRSRCASRRPWSP